jgi:MoxR-like ATPase
VRFVHTPASIWGAHAVFVDEISRARPDIQNRLFPIVHERRVQGLPLPDLRHRWAAMNPPSDDDDEALYVGSQPLDVALADRFALVVSMPDWHAFSDAQQEAVILAPRVSPDPLAGAQWSAAIARTRELLPLVHAQWSASIARYVRILSSLLAQAKAPISARRAGMLAGNVAAVHAARLSADAHARIDDSTWIAAVASMPFAACGRPFDEARLLACHKEAWRQAAVRADDAAGRILSERDPIARVRLALAAGDALPDGELTSIVADAVTGAPDGVRHALAEWLFESGTIERLSVVAADTVAEVYRDLACVQEVFATVPPNGARHRVWKRLQQRLGTMPDAMRAERAGNLLATMFSSNRLEREDDVDAVLARYDAARERLAADEPAVGAAR